MRRALLCLGLLLAAQPALAGGDSPGAATETPASPTVPKHISKELASGDGKSRATAFVVHATSEGEGVDKEYEILRFLHMRPGTQSLIADGKTYDMIEATDPKSGEIRQVWFDISMFFGKLF